MTFQLVNSTSKLRGVMYHQVVSLFISVQNSDYVIPSTSLEIGPFSQNGRRACVDVNITDDRIAENVESFAAMLVARPSSPPLLVIDPADTTVDIEDNDGELLLIVVTIHSLQFIYIVIVVGWERPDYDTSEDEDMVELCAVIRSPSEIDRDPFTLVVSCTPGSAGEQMALLLRVNSNFLVTQ